MAARHATISADVHGDFVAACQELFIQGNVSNDVAIAASHGSLSGHVGGDVRSVAGDLNVSGHIDGDLVVAAGRVHLLPGAVVGGDVFLAGGELFLDGTMEKSLGAAAGTAEINGTVKGPAKIRTSELKIGPNANLGALAYFSPQEATIEAGATVKGPVNYYMIAGMDQDWFGRIVRRYIVGLYVIGYLMALAAGLLAFLLLRRSSQALVSYGLSHFGRELLRGFVLFFVVPPAIFLLLATLVGIPVAFLGGLMHLSFGVLAVVFAGISLGTLLLTRLRQKSSYELTFGSVWLGISLSFVIGLIPYAGPLTNTIFFLVMFGSLYQRFWAFLRRENASAAAPTRSAE